MSDVRALLRQQREARRIDHPQAAYSDAGKLLCTLCRDQVKTEALWDSHLQSASHRQNAQRARSAAESLGNGIERKDHAETTAESSNSDEADAPAAAESTMASHPKRKHSRDEDGDDIMDEAVRRKRSRPDISEASARSDSETRPHRSNSETLTPPSLARRPSTTPSQGVELQIPSRPATPSYRDGSSTSTPGAAASNGATNGQQASRPGKASASATAASADGETSNTPSTAQVDESEWAAFEADIAAASVPYDEDATISAPAMTAEEAAAAAQSALNGEGNDASKRKTKADVDLEDEKEEATRALEEEFEEMEELEARVQRLREKREDIRRKRSESHGQATAAAPTKLNNGVGKENIQGTMAGNAVAEGDEEDEDDEEDDEDDWDSFRLRGR
ncbi:hypothetical protein NLU13_6618 [Sarocladium strictum]|uniref:Coiled-coil domain-containing protein 16 n=1 Tax=Sarocladium strictum TaxID=5046 RepID=A0AA39GG79_SARSR|nr:hypothetical protein NLU13_6618 [Sarocladium strictum]